MTNEQLQHATELKNVIEELDRHRYFIVKLTEKKDCAYGVRVYYASAHELLEKELLPDHWLEVYLMKIESKLNVLRAEFDSL